MLRSEDSGQALIEAAIFAPLVIFGFAAIIYFSQLGILSERSESAVRYGNDVSYKNGNSIYGVSTLYSLLDEVQNPNDNELGPLCLQNTTPGATAPVTAASPSRIQSDMAKALVLQEAGASPAPRSTPFPGSVPLYKPATISSSPCQAGAIRLASTTSTAGSQNGGLPLSTAGFQISSTIHDTSQSPPIEGLKFLFMGTPNLETSAHMTFVNVAAPSVLAACTPEGLATLTLLQPNLTAAQKQSIASYCPTSP